MRETERREGGLISSPLGQECAVWVWVALNRSWTSLHQSRRLPVDVVSEGGLQRKQPPAYELALRFSSMLKWKWLTPQ